MISSTDIDVFLDHQGVKGMKWGVRKTVAKEVENHKKRKLHKYGDKEKGLTKAQQEERTARTIRRVDTGVRLAVAATFVAVAIHANRQAKVSDLGGSGPRARTTAQGAKSAKDTINRERDKQVSSLRRMHKEGKMDDAQLKSFLKKLNDRYDRKITDL